MKNTHGTVIAVNKQTSRIAVQVHDGDISILDAESLTDIELDHVIYGPLEYEAEDEMFNKTEQIQIHARVEATGCDLKTAKYHLINQ